MSSITLLVVYPETEINSFEWDVKSIIFVYQSILAKLVRLVL